MEQERLLLSTACLECWVNQVEVPMLWESMCLKMLESWGRSWVYALSKTFCFHYWPLGSILVSLQTSKEWDSLRKMMRLDSCYEIWSCIKRETKKWKDFREVKNENCNLEWHWLEDQNLCFLMSHLQVWILLHEEKCGICLNPIEKDESSSWLLITWKKQTVLVIELESCLTERWCAVDLQSFWRTNMEKDTI